MRILFVLDRLRDGGAQAQALDLARGLVGRGVDVRVAALHAGPGDADPVGVAARVLGGPPSARALPASCLRLLGLCRRERPDLIHSHAEPADLAGRSVRLALGIPHASTAHSLRPWHWSRGRGLFLERRGAFLTRGFVAVSDAVAAMLRDEVGVAPDRIRTIPNWAPPAPPAPDASDAPALARDPTRPTIVHVARLDVPKRQEILLEAFRAVRREFPGAVLRMVGSGPEERRLRGLAGEGVEFLGHRNDVRSLLRQADLFALSSRWEGMPISALEAMEEGLPVVATAVGGVPELVEEGVTGRLVPEGDARALAAAIVACLRDPGAARAMGDAGRRRVEGRRERALDAYLRFYADLLRPS